MSECEADLKSGDTVGSELITSSRESNIELILGGFSDGSGEAEPALEQLRAEASLSTLVDDKLHSDNEEAATIIADLETPAVISANANGSVDAHEADSAHNEAVQVQSSITETVETVQISNADSSNEVITTKEVYIHNSRLCKPKGEDKDEKFEVVEVIGTPGDSKKPSTSSEVNPLTDVNNDDLLAILEGDPDSTTAKADQAEEADGQTIVFEVIDTDNDKETILEPDEVKKIAMDQIQSIVKKRGRPAIKNIKQDGGSLVSALVSDWSDNEKDGESTNESSAAMTKRQAKSQSPAVSPAKQSPAATQEKKIAVVRKKAPPAKDSVKKIAPTVASFKSARVIKKKIIWDPDAPETKISYASLVKSSPVGSKRSAPSSGRSTPTLPVQKRKIDTATPTEKSMKVTSTKPVQHTTAAEKTRNVLAQPTQIRAKVQYASLVKAKPASTLTPSKPTATLVASKPTSTLAPPKPTPTTPPLKPKIAQAVVHVRNIGKMKRATPSPTTAVQSKRKRVSEIDRLLSDEGAANMLNTLDPEKPSKPVQKDGGRARKPSTPTLPQAEKTPKKGATRKAGGRQSATSSWDYVYNQRNVDSLIIRRRSNSSYSSTTSPRRLSVDLKPERSLKGTRAGGFEFVKPETKKGGKRSSDAATEVLIVEDIKKTRSPESVRKSSRTPVPAEPKEVSAKSGKMTPTMSSACEEKSTSEVTIKRHGNIVQMILKPKMEKIRNTFSVQLMNEVVRQLDVLESDDACKVLVITSVGPSFCQGVDFLSLTQGNADKRKTAAQELAGSVTSFLKALITFPKPLIAGIIGSCSGIGVTMLPAFDVVIASDKSTFETPYAKIGQIPEGNGLLTSTNNVRHSFKTKLLWFCEKLTSTEAALSGLVTELTAPSKVSDDAVQYGKRIASLSQQSLTSIKSQKVDIKRLMTTLNEEQKLLASHWQSPECQEKFKQYIAKESW